MLYHSIHVHVLITLLLLFAIHILLFYLYQRSNLFLKSCFLVNIQQVSFCFLCFLSSFQSLSPFLRTYICFKRQDNIYSQLIRVCSFDHLFSLPLLFPFFFLSFTFFFFKVKIMQECTLGLSLQLITSLLSHMENVNKSLKEMLLRLYRIYLSQDYPVFFFLSLFFFFF